MKKIISIVFLILALSVGGLILGPGFIDWNKYKPDIIGRLHDLTGHDYKLDGPIEFALVPSPRLKLEKLSVSMPENADISPLVSLQKVTITVEPLPLLEKKIVIRHIELHEPSFNLTKQEDGKLLWMTKALEEKIALGKAVPEEPKGDLASALGNAVSLNDVRVIKGRITYTDLKKKRKTEISDINLDIKADSLFGPFTVSGKTAYAGKNFDVVFKSGKIAADKAAIPLQLTLQTADGQIFLSYSGVGDFQSAPELQGELTAKSSNLLQLMNKSAASMGAAFNGPAQASGLLTYQADSIEYKNMSVSLGKMQGQGQMLVKNISKAGGKPVGIEVSLKTQEGFALESFVPVAKEKSKTFLPENISVPSGIALALDVQAKKLTYKAADLSDVSFSVQMGEKSVSGKLAAVTAGQGKTELAYTLTPVSSSKAETGSMIWSDPKLTLEGTFSSAVPAGLMKAFVDEKTIKSLGGVLTSSASSKFNFSITPREAEFKNVKVSALATDISLDGKYSRRGQGQRDLLKISASSSVLDYDDWMNRLKPAEKKAVETVPDQQNKKAAIADLAKKMSLPMDLDANFSVSSLTVQGKVYDQVHLTTQLTGKALNIQSAGLTSSLGDKLSLVGSVGDITALNDVDLTMQGKLVDTEKTLQLLKVDTKSVPRNMGASEILAEFKGQADNLAFVANAKALKGTLETSGTVTDLMNVPQIGDLTFRLRHPSFVELARIFNPDFKSSVAISKNLDVYASINRQDKVYAFKDFQATIGPSVITGQVSFDASATKPRLNADIIAKDLALSDLLGVEKGNKGSTKVAANDNVRWSRNALNVDWMRRYDADIKLSANKLSWQNWQLENAVIQGKLENAVMDIPRITGDVYGGSMMAHLIATAPAASRDPVVVSGGVGFKQVSLESFVSSFSGARLVKAKGVIDFDANVEAKGVSPAAMIFSLQGKGQTAGQSLVFEGFDLARVSRTLAQPSSSMTENVVALLDTSMAGGQTSFDTMEGQFSINEGVINFDKFQMVGPEATVNTTGKVNLALWTMDLENTVMLVEPVDAPPLKVSFRGPLDNPGKAVGKSALESYVGGQIKKAIGDALIKSLGGDTSGAIGSPTGTTTTAPEGQDPASTGEAPATETIKPRDLLQNIIQQQLAPKTQTAPVQDNAQGSGATNEVPREQAVPETPESGAEVDPIQGLIQNLMDQ